MMAALLFASVSWIQADPIDALIERLGSASSEVRERASKTLRGLGEKAFPALRRALKSTNVEIQGRARDILAAQGIWVMTIKAVDPSALAKLLNDLFRDIQDVAVFFDPKTRAIVFRGREYDIAVAKEVVGAVDLDALKNAKGVAGPESEVIFQDLRVPITRRRAEY